VKVNQLDFDVFDSFVNIFEKVEDFKLFEVEVYLLQSTVEFSVQCFFTNKADLLVVIVGNRLK